MSEQKPSLANWQSTSYLSAGNAAYVEELYDQFLQDPNLVSTNGNAILYFGEWPCERRALHEFSHRQIQEQL